MSSGKKKKANTKRSSGKLVRQANPQNGTVKAGAGRNGKSAFLRVKISDAMASAPGVLMLVPVMVMLIADLTAKDPQAQYDLYPAVFRVVNIIVCFVGAAFTAFSFASRRGSKGQGALAASSRGSKEQGALAASSRGSKGQGALAASRRGSKDKKPQKEKGSLAANWRPRLIWAAFLVWIFISTCINGFNDAAIHGVSYRNIGVPHMAVFILIYMGLSSRIVSEKCRMFILIGFSAAADLLAISVFWDMLSGGIAAYHAKKELSAIFFNGNHYGYFLAMAVLVGLGLLVYSEGWHRIIGALTALMNFALLAVNHSLGSMAAVIIVVIVMAAMTAAAEPGKRRRLAIVFGAAAVIFALAVIIVPGVRAEFSGLFKDLGSILGGQARGSEGHNRLKVWTRTWAYIMEKPVFGFGCEGIADRLYIAFAISNPHSEPLTYAAYYGIPAALIYLCGILAAFAGFLRRALSDASSVTACRKIACMAAAGYFISSFTGVAMFYTLPFFFIMLGVMMNREAC